MSKHAAPTLQQSLYISASLAVSRIIGRFIQQATCQARILGQCCFQADCKPWYEDNQVTARQQIFFGWIMRQKCWFLTINRWTGQICPIKCTSFVPEWENTVLQWAFKLNSALAAAETWYLKGCMLKVNIFNNAVLKYLCYIAWNGEGNKTPSGQVEINTIFINVVLSLVSSYLSLYIYTLF
jgi:hypothetical protein